MASAETWEAGLESFNRAERLAESPLNSEACVEVQVRRVAQRSFRIDRQVVGAGKRAQAGAQACKPRCGKARMRIERDQRPRVNAQRGFWANHVFAAHAQDVEREAERGPELEASGVEQVARAQRQRQTRQLDRTRGAVARFERDADRREQRGAEREAQPRGSEREANPTADGGAIDVDCVGAVREELESGSPVAG